MSSSSSAGVTGSSGGHQQATTSLADTQRFNDYHFASFITQEVPVTVVPRFTMNAVDGLGGRFGPFTPNYPVEIPLWLALHLRQTDACTVQAPSYLRVPWLQQVLEREQASASGFEPLPFYFFEVAKLLCSSTGGAQADVPAVAEVLRLVGDIKATRQQKLRRSMAVFEAEDRPMLIPGIKLTSIVHNELLYLRHSFALVLQQAAEMEQSRASPLTITAPIGTVTSLASSPSGTDSRPRVGARRPSSLAGTSTVLSGSPTAGDGTRPSTDAPLSMFDTQTSPSRTTAALSEAPTAEGLSQSTATTAATPEGAPAPPVKKRRTLRQT